MNQFSTGEFLPFFLILAIVSPVYYVIFTTLTLIAAGILAGSNVIENAVDFATLVFGFFTIVGGVALLFEYSRKLSKVADLARSGTDSGHSGGSSEEHGLRLSVEDEDRIDRRSQKSPLEIPLMDSNRTSFTIVEPASEKTA